jgi:hypothetical protein
MEMRGVLWSEDGARKTPPGLDSQPTPAGFVFLHLYTLPDTLNYMKWPFLHIKMMTY